MNKIDWIFFDVGGVLIDDTVPEKGRIDLIYKIVQRYKPAITKKDILAVRPAASAMVGGLSDNLLQLLLGKELATESLLEEIRGEKMDYLDNAVIRPEAQEVAEQLSKKYQLGILANQPVKTREKLEQAGVLDWFTHKGMSGDYNLHKPDPKLFKAIFAETGANPRTSVMIDDNIERGLMPAKKFGMTTIWYKAREREVPREAVDMTINALGDLLNFF